MKKLIAPIGMNASAPIVPMVLSLLVQIAESHISTELNTHPASGTSKSTIATISSTGAPGFWTMPKRC
ncbi:MAG: hypothetical protein LC739_09295 [Actinobacteria bacterium]|nr:hypothetical protein [Actinomycetota bacterium]